MRFLGLLSKQIKIFSRPSNTFVRSMGAHVHSKRKASNGEYDIDELAAKPSQTDQLIAKGLAVMLWLWIMISMKQNNGKFIVRLKY